MLQKNSQDMRLQENHGLQNSPWGGEVNHIWPLAYNMLPIDLIFHFQPMF